MFDSIKRWLGRPPPPPINCDPFGREARQVAQASTRRPAPPPPELPPVLLQRAEIIDAKTRIAGYRFDVQGTGPSQEVDPSAAFDALVAANVAAFAQRRMTMIPLNAQNWFKFDFPSLIGPHTVFLLDRAPANAENFDRWREVVKSIRSAGARVGIAGADIAGERQLIDDYADFLLLDYPSYSLPNFERVVAQLAREQPSLEIAAANIGSWAERRYCVARGLAYCMGSFTTAADETQQSGEIGQDRLVLIEMLNLVRSDADAAAIAAIARRDPGVAIKIVSMANSPLQGLSTPVASIDQACMVLGREQLYRWLSICMFRATPGSPRDEILLELALRRGRFLELVGRDLRDKGVRDELFLLGLLSLLDCMLGVPMAKVLERLHISKELRDVLLRSEGPLARYLSLAIAVEKGGVENIARLCGELAIAESEIGAASTAALAWAEEAMRHGK
jgi:EAL and modified HD-GYP domain-containing signal transduction protein